MDEPLSNLDAKLRVQTRSEIKQLQRQVGTTTVYVTHDQVEAMTMGDRVAVMNDGQLEQVGDTRTVYEHPANVFVAGFIGSPGMTFATLDATRNGGPVTLARGGVSLSVDPAGATEQLPERGDGRHPPRARARLARRRRADGPHRGVRHLRGDARPRGADRRQSSARISASRCTPTPTRTRQIGDRLPFGVERGRLYLFDPDDRARARRRVEPGFNPRSRTPCGSRRRTACSASCPHRQSVCRFRTSYGSPSAATTWTPPRTQIGPSSITATAGG